MVFLNPAYFYNKIYYWLFDLFTFSVVTVFMAKVIWFGLGVLFFIAIIILKRKQAALAAVETEAMAAAIRQAQTKSETEGNHAWEKILNYLNSDNASDWKLAVLEADTILDAIVQKMGYRGENLGERLKNVEPSDFNTLNDAWEAHKVRNAIAHEAGYELTQREAKRVIKLFENVFREFEYL